MSSKTIEHWLVRFGIDSDNQHKSAHEILFKNLNSLDDKTKWLSNSSDQRVVQFVAYPEHVIARLNKEPRHVICLKVQKTFSTDQEIELAVKLCGSLEKKKKIIGTEVKVSNGRILTDDEKLEFAENILIKSGLNVLGLAIQDSENIKFVKNKRIVQIKTFEVHAKCKIIDLDKFVEAWNIGIGKRRTWGCGMLRVREAIDV
jgi:hypothetical protein